MGHVDGRQAQVREDGAQLLGKALAQGAVQRPHGLVEHEQARLGGQRSRQGHALLLAAGELVHRPPFRPGQAHELEQVADASADGLRPGAAHAQPEGHVVAHVAMREERVVLEHEADPALVRGDTRQVVPVEVDAARPWLLQAGHGTQQGGLAAAAGTQHAEQLAGRYVQVDAAQDVLALVGRDQPAHAEHRRA